MVVLATYLSPSHGAVFVQKQACDVACVSASGLPLPSELQGGTMQDCTTKRQERRLLLPSIHKNKVCLKWSFSFEIFTKALPVRAYRHSGLLWTTVGTFLPF